MSNDRFPDDWEQFIAEWTPKLFKFLRQMQLSDEDAEDVLYETFLAFPHVMQTHPGDVSPATFLYGIANRKATDLLHRRRVEEIIPAKSEAASILKLANLLPTMSRDAFILRYHLRLPIREMASLLNLAPKVTEALLSHVRKTLKKRLTDHDKGSSHLPDIEKRQLWQLCDLFEAQNVRECTATRNTIVSLKDPNGARFRCHVRIWDISTSGKLFLFTALPQGPARWQNSGTSITNMVAKLARGVVEAASCKPSECAFVECHTRATTGKADTYESVSFQWKRTEEKWIAYDPKWGETAVEYIEQKYDVEL